MNICATTAQFPGLLYRTALEQIRAGVQENLWGTLGHQHVQICPQSAGVVTEQACEELVEKHHDISLRLHANARVLRERHVLWDISSFCDETLFYYEALADRSKRLGSTCMSMHAGYQDQCSKEKLWDNHKRIQDVFDRVTDCTVVVAMEGLYPSSHRAQWIASWAEYEEMMRRGVPFALDLSHLNIVARHEKKWQDQLLNDLMSSSLCREIHVSDNDGTRDQHRKVQKKPYWWGALQSASLPAHAVVFSEGNLLPR